MPSDGDKYQIRLKTLFFAVLGLTFLFHLASAYFGYPHYRDIHVGAAVEYARHGRDILKPVIVGFNATNTPTPQELPLWQVVASLVLKPESFQLVGAVMVSLLFYLAGLWPLYRLANAYLGHRGAWWTLIFYAFQPLVFLFAGTASADGLTLSAMIWFVYACDRLVRNASIPDFLFALALGILLVLLKLPYFLTGGITAFFLLLLHGPRSFRRWLLLALVGGISAIIFFFWSRYLDYCYAMAEFPQVNLRMTPGSPMWDWYFGSWSFRLNPMSWIKGGWSALNSLFGSFALVSLAVCSLVLSKNRVGQFWFLGAFLATLVFTHLVLVHRHYYLLYSPAIALLGASSALWLEGKMTTSSILRQWSYTGVGALILLASLAQGLMGIEVVQNYDGYAAAIAQSLAEKTAPEDKLLIVGGGWGGDMLIRTGRNGLSLADTRILDNPKNIPRLRELGFTKLVMISEPPLLTALKKTNPGSSKLERETWDHFITPTPAGWPVIYQSEDLLIKGVPEN